MAMAERGMKGRHVGVTTLLYRVEEPRMYRRGVRSYGELSSLLETRHEHLYRNRRRFRQIASAGLALKFAWTVIDRLPLPPPARRYAYFGALVLCEPSRRWRSKA